MNSIPRKLAIITMLLGSHGVFANNLSYDMTSLSYFKTDYLGEATAFSFTATRSLGSSLFYSLGASYQKRDNEDYLFSQESNSNGLNAGIGFRAPINRSSDIYSTFSYSYIQTENRYLKTQNSHVGGAEVGIRTKLTRNFELDTSVGFTKTEDVEAEAFFALSGYYSFTKHFSFGVGLLTGEELRSAGLIGRMHF